MRSLTVLLVEDDPAACETFSACAESMEELEIVHVIDSESAAREAILDHRPDVVILDLELHQGSGSGLNVLRWIHETPLEVKPYVVITTNNSNPITYDFARQMDAGYIWSKHQDDYAEREVLELILAMRDVIQRDRKQATAESTPHQRRTRLLKRIDTELNLVGVSPKMKGRQYLIDEIELRIEDPERQNLSEIVGTSYGKTKQSVDRAMQGAIDKAWKTTDIDELLKYYKARINPEKGVPTVTEFVCYYANKIKNEL